jgi:hypothetical protein
LYACTVTAFPPSPADFERLTFYHSTCLTGSFLLSDTEYHRRRDVLAPHVFCVQVRTFISAFDQSTLTLIFHSMSSTARSSCTSFPTTPNMHHRARISPTRVTPRRMSLTRTPCLSLCQRGAVRCGAVRLRVCSSDDQIRHSSWPWSTRVFGGICAKVKTVCL